MTGEELQVLLTLRSTLSEYEHFMTELSTMIERGVDVPPCGSAKFPMRDKLYGQVRDLVLGKSAMEADAVRGKLFSSLRDIDSDLSKLDECLDNDSKITRLPNDGK